MKKYISIAILILLLTVIASSFIVEVQAVGLDQIMDNPDKYKEPEGINNGDLIDIGNTIVWIIRTVGTALSVIIFALIGIKYILGSVEEKAEYKQTMWPYILGAILILAGSSLTSIIYNIFQN